jgi:UDP-N-acetylmuramate dehydrogenase
VPAGWIIDRAQLKGTKVGHVQVSEKHGNFFVSDGQAKADDVVALTAVLKTRVRNMSEGNVLLHEEVEYVGF